MKLFKTIRNRLRRRSVHGVTLTEMMITAGIFLYIFTGTWLAIQIFGLRVYTLAATKLMATTSGRQALNQIRDQIRGGKLVYVGTCSNTIGTSFQLITNGLQQGNALIVYPTTNLTYYSVFYLDTSTSTNRLIQFHVNTNGATIYTNTLAKYLTNQIVFDMEDWQTNIASSEASLDNRLLIRVTMQFSQWEYPVAFIGTNALNAYDYYQLRTRIFRRAWN